MNIESMTDQQIIDYLRTHKKSFKVIGVAKAHSVDEFFERYAPQITVGITGLNASVLARWD